MKYADLIFAARPMLILPVWTVYLIALHYHHRLSGETFNLTDLAVLGVLTLAFAGAYYVNQVYDEETDRINGKVGFLQKGYLTATQLMLTAAVVSAVALILASLIALATLVIASQIVLLGWLYSAPPVRLKDRPFWSLFANAWAVGLLPVLAVMPDMSIHTTGLLGWDNPFFFLAAVGSITLLTMSVDRVGDAASNKRTLAVVAGPRLSLGLAALLMIVAAWIAFASGYALLFYAAGIAVLFQLAALVAAVERVILAATKVPLLILVAIAGVQFPGYILFLVVLIVCTRAYYIRRFGIIYPSLI